MGDFNEAGVSRVPPGTSDGGRFTHSSHPESDVMLSEVGYLELSDDEYNADGTYSFPPMPRSAEQHLRFWMRVPVPDSVLQQVADVYSLKRAQRYNSIRHTLGPAWWAKMSRQEKKEYAKQGITTLEQFIEQQQGLERQKHPMAIAPQEARAIVRGYSILKYGGRLPKSEQRKILPFKISVIGGELPLSEFDRRYPFDEMGMRESFNDPNNDVREAIERLHASIVDRL